MGSSRRLKPFPRSAVSLLVTAAMVTTVGGTDVVERLVLAASQPERAPVSAVRADVVATEPLVSFGQQVQSRVVLRQAPHVDAKGKDLWSISEVGGYDVPAAAMRAYQTAATTMRRQQPGCN